MDTNQPRRSEQDGEYLHDAHVIIAKRCTAVLDEAFAHDLASDILDALAAAGWHLLNYDDAEKVLGAYVMSQIR